MLNTNTLHTKFKKIKSREKKLKKAFKGKLYLTYTKNCEECLSEAVSCRFSNLPEPNELC